VIKYYDINGNTEYESTAILFAIISRISKSHRFTVPRTILLRS